MASTNRPVLGGRETVKVAIAQVLASHMDRQSSIERAIGAMVSIEQHALRRTGELYDIDKTVVESIAERLGVIAS